LGLRGGLLVAGAGSRALPEVNGFIVLALSGAEEVECLGDGAEEVAGETGAETAATAEFTDKCRFEGEEEAKGDFKLKLKPPCSSASRPSRCWFLRLLLKKWRIPLLVRELEELCEEVRLQSWGLLTLLRVMW